MSNLERLNGQMSIPLPKDETGYTGRECPECERYFKIAFGTGLPGSSKCHCPYCGHNADQSYFHTKEQTEYATSIAFKEVEEALFKDLKNMEFDIKPRGAFGIGMSMKVNRGSIPQIKHYTENELETEVVCDNCTLRYAVYGVFAYCPDCAQHNSLQILNMDYEVIEKMLGMAAGSDAAVQKKLIEDALEDCVSSFDGFGRNLCRLHSQKASNQAQAEKISFQNIAGAQKNLIDQFGLDIAAGLPINHWDIVIRCFQKRHLICHKMGVIDDEYIQKSGDISAVVGRKIQIDADEVRQLIGVLKTMSSDIMTSLENKP